MAAQAELADAIRRMTALLEEDPSLPVLGSGHLVTQTDVALIVSALLRSVDIEIFELAMWQSWGIGLGMRDV